MRKAGPRLLSSSSLAPANLLGAQSQSEPTEFYLHDQIPDASSFRSGERWDSFSWDFWETVRLKRRHSLECELDLAFYQRRRAGVAEAIEDARSHRFDIGGERGRNKVLYDLPGERHAVGFTLRLAV